jgi:anti-anti-sigma factor
MRAGPHQQAHADSSVEFRRLRALYHYHVERYTRLLCALQDGRLRLRSHWRALYELRTRANPASGVVPPPQDPIPLFRVVRGRAGHRRIIRAPSLSGGEGLLDCAIERVPGALVVHVHGEVDLSTVPVLRRCLDEAATPGEAVLLDLSALGYLDAGGARVLDVFRKRHRGPLVIAGCRPIVHRVIEVTGLAERTPIFSRPDEALQYLRTPR